MILPIRPGKPKDKPLVENAVRLVYQKIFAKLRNQTFFSLYELNEAIWETHEGEQSPGENYNGFKISSR